MTVQNHSDKSTPIIEMKNITKRFGSFYALKGIDLVIYPGEVHALMGENGAGKSTLMKVLSGTYVATEGDIFIDGNKTLIQSPQDAIHAKISIIHQEINLSPYLTVAENIYMGQEPHRGVFLDRKTMLSETQIVLKKLNAGFTADQKAEELTIAEQQQVEIARALHRQSRILVMDEPTAALSSRETDVLFELIKLLRSQGVAIVYISHRMNEIYELADRVTVLRDGASVGQLLRHELNADKLVSMMVGRPLSDLFVRQRPDQFGPVVLDIQDFSDGGRRVKTASFNVRSGEIVGLSGLVGSGRSELSRLIFGADKKKQGTVFLNGKKVTISNPAQAIAMGIGYLPENRKDQGLFLELSILDNIIMNNLIEDSRGHIGLLDSKKGKKRAVDVISKMRIRLSSMMNEVSSLSGGNQQKTLFARWVSIGPKVLILDEPTRGVDVGAKADIYHTMNELAHLGCAIVMISSELPEIVGMCDRVYVMHEGIVVGEVGDGTETAITQENIMKLATGASHVIH